jgi:hypothetical protein
MTARDLAELKALEPERLYVFVVGPGVPRATMCSVRYGLRRSALTVGYTTSGEEKLPLL